MPEPEVTFSFELVCSIKPSGEKIYDFLNYYSKTYLKGNFQVSLWNQSDSLTKSAYEYDTVNKVLIEFQKIISKYNVERHNLGLREYINTTKPNIYSLIKHIKDLKTIFSLNYLCLNIDKKIQRKRDFIYVKREEEILELHRLYSHKQIPMFNFLKLVSYFLYILYDLSDDIKEKSDLKEPSTIRKSDQKEPAQTFEHLISLVIKFDY